MAVLPSGVPALPGEVPAGLSVPLIRKKFRFKRVYDISRTSKLFYWGGRGIGWGLKIGN